MLDDTVGGVEAPGIASNNKPNVGSGRTASDSRIPSLDGLRALAILMVLVGHAVISAGSGSWWTATYAHLGVLVFFVVSGYLITTLMLREAGRTGAVNVQQFYIRRVWRILPVAYAYLTVITVLQHTQFSWRDISLSWGLLASYAACFDNFPWDLGHLWSLSVEEQFYFVWPLIVASSICWAKRTAWAAVIIAPLFRYLFGHYGFEKTAYYSLPAVMDSIATGCLIALYAKPLTRLVGNRRWLGIVWLVAFCAPALIVIADHTRFLWPLPQLFGHCAWTLFNVCVGVGILWAIAAQPRVLNHRFPVWLGTISYSLYVWHMPFMNPQAEIAFPLNFVMAFAAAFASYSLLEQPILRLRNRLSDRDTVSHGRPLKERAIQAVFE